MTKAEFVRLVNEKILTLLFHNAETGVVSASCVTGVVVTMRPDLPGIPIRKGSDGIRKMVE